MKEPTNQNSHKITSEIVKLYTSIDLPPEMEKEVQNWLLSNFHTKEKEDALWNIWNNLPNIPKSETNKAWKEIIKKIGAEEKPIIPLYKRRNFQAAAVFIPLLLFGSIIYMNLKGYIEVEEDAVYIEQLVFSTSDEAQSIVLPDETEVQLNKLSEIMYNEDRVVKLIGEASFNVKHQNEQSFTVSSENLTATVTGTYFNIQVYPNLEEDVITLYEGNLQVKVNDTLILMSAGEELVFNFENKQLSVEKTSKSIPHWNREYISYNDTELEDIFRDLEKKYAITIKGGSKSVLSDTVTLKMEGKPEIEKVMLLLSEINGKFKYTIENDTIHIH